MKQFLLACSFTCAVLSHAMAATCTASTGNWTTAGNWSCGHVPACGDSLVIPAGVTVTVDAVIDLSGCGTPIKVNVAGTLAFQTGKKLTLPCGSAVYVQSGATVQPGAGGGSSNLIDICGTDLWTAGYGPVSGPVNIVCCNPLPVELTSFDALCADKVVQLNWSTASETNSAFFTVQRSDEENHIQDIGTVQASGTTSSPHEYSFVDESPLRAASYYRLLQTDLNGDVIPFNFIASDCYQDDIMIYPNPANGVFTVSGTNSFEQIEIIDIAGRCVLKTDATDERTVVNVASFDPAFYVVKVTLNGYPVFSNYLAVSGQ